MKCEMEFVLDLSSEASPPAHIHTLAHLNYSPLTDLQFRIKVAFTKSISRVVLKLVKTKKHGTKVRV